MQSCLYSLSPIFLAEEGPEESLRLLTSELEERAGPEQGNHSQRRYLPLTLVDKLVGSGVRGGHVWE